MYRNLLSVDAEPWVPIESSVLWLFFKHYSYLLAKDTYLDRGTPSERDVQWISDGSGRTQCYHS